MAQAVTDGGTPGVTLFNGALETGVRAVVMLDAVFPRSLDLARLTWCYHLVVHSADIGGPPSLHPEIPQRTGELLVRRRLVEEGVNLMRRLHMIDAKVSTEGNPVSDGRGSLGLRRLLTYELCARVEGTGGVACELPRRNV
jgi:hypothetical protein